MRDVPRIQRVDHGVPVLLEQRMQLAAPVARYFLQTDDRTLVDLGFQLAHNAGEPRREPYVSLV